ncbi:MAG: hypothetical protein U0354_08685 [Candidatus Sericytochromatia bacterium]
MKNKEAVPLKKVVKNILGNIKSNKYLQGLDFAYIDSNDIYQGALSNLISGNTEKTLKCLIFGLDIDRENTSLIHLARTMLYSLSEDFYESGGDIYRQKYTDLGKAVEQLTTKVENLKEESRKKGEAIEFTEKEIEEKKKSFFYFFSKGKLNNKLTTLRLELSNTNTELFKSSEDLEKVTLLEKIEEYMKLLGVVLEVCIFPARFTWIMSS